MDGPNNGIVFYHYPFSPYARRVLWYLSLRGIDYAQAIQPATMPRPDLEAIGVKYRRIPLMAIGKDVYCDTRLILSKLEQLFPGNTLSASDADGQAIQHLLQSWKIESGVFARASQLIPSSMPLMRDPKFTKDREQLSGRSWSKELVDAARPEALTHIRNSFVFLETVLLANGREWVLKSDKPTMADIEAIWAFDWLIRMKSALPTEIISGKQFPQVFAWVERFNKTVKAATQKSPKAPKVSGADAAKRVLGSNFAEPEGTVDSTDPSGLKKGDAVRVWPTDSGFTHKDHGSLVALNGDEIVIAIENGIRVHFPRTGFRIRAADGRKPSKL